jgi:hypothetical protein
MLSAQVSWRFQGLLEYVVWAQGMTTVQHEHNNSLFFRFLVSVI